MSLVITMLYILIAAIQPLLCSSTHTVLELERAVSIRGPSNLSQLLERDRVRHGRLLHSQDGVINYTLGGTDDISVGLYYTTLQLGTPPSSFYVQVDTGSDITWIGCMPCTYCPPLTTSIPNISLHLYNPITSSTFSAIICNEKRCPTDIRVSPSTCAADNNDHCRFRVDYADQSRVFGFYVQDLLTYDRTMGTSRSIVKSTAPFIFGCATVEIGFLSSSMTDGILGLGQRGVSMISEISAKKLSPKVFAHCLRGDGDGGGILILGEIVELDIVYTPLIPSQPHYNLDLQRISVNGQTLPIDPHKLSSSDERGAFVDSGTTLGYLKMEALVQLNNAINASTSARWLLSPFNYPCYEVVTRGISTSYHAFCRGADLILGPGDYLVYQGLMDGLQMWCMGFRPAYGENPVVLGDLVMKNRLFVYDLDRQRIGWKNYNCSKPLSIAPMHGNRSRAAGNSVGFRLVLWMTTILLLLPWL